MGTQGTLRQRLQSVVEKSPPGSPPNRFSSHHEVKDRLLLHQAAQSSEL